MPVLAIINAKGGSGKSTLATSISAYAASVGIKLMLGDLDPQQSIRTWLRLRSEKLPVIASWLVDSARVFRPPAGVTHAVLDTPSGIAGLYLARIVMASNIVLIPVAASAFDRDAAADCIANLRLLPRVSSGQCTLVCVGIRIQPDSARARALQAWADAHDIQLLGVVRNSNVYLSCVDHGSSIFDIESSNAASLREDWQPLLTWLGKFFLGNLPATQLETVSDVKFEPNASAGLVASLGLGVQQRKQNVSAEDITQISSNEIFSNQHNYRDKVIESLTAKVPASSEQLSQLTSRSFPTTIIVPAGTKPLANSNQNIHAFLRKENA